MYGNGSSLKNNHLNSLQQIYDKIIEYDNCTWQSETETYENGTILILLINMVFNWLKLTLFRKKKTCRKQK